MEVNPPPQTTTNHHLSPPPGLTDNESNQLKPSITNFHSYHITPSQCSSILAQHIHAPADIVWSVVRRFDKPQTYKHFIKSCTVSEHFTIAVGCTRDVDVISGLPASTSTERLDVLDDENHVLGFTVIGGEHRLRNYHAVTTVHELIAVKDSRPTTVVLESYAVDVPEGNTKEDTRLFADTVVKLNLQKLAAVTEAMAHEAAAGIKGLSLR
ncbi:abscisic acid receptor PYR1-like [Bidens hawaiensis]|uniref:abscisic acid receptor PYR1-like n=1 Tax=Bidens hawaiensis TaxID=980011 RepID=UPI00404A967E